MYFLQRLFKGLFQIFRFQLVAIILHVTRVVGIHLHLVILLNVQSKAVILFSWLGVICYGAVLLIIQNLLGVVSRRVAEVGCV